MAYSWSTIYVDMLRNLFFFIIFSFFFVYGQDLAGEMFDDLTSVKKLSVGSVVYLDFKGDFSFDFQANSMVESTPNAQSSQISRQYLPFLPNAGAAQSHEKDIKISAKDKSSGRIAATVIAYDEKANTYKVSANRNIVYNDQDGSSIALIGLVDAQSIYEESVINVAHLANLSLVYRDKVQSIRLNAADFVRLLEKNPPKTEDGDALSSSAKNIPFEQSEQNDPQNIAQKEKIAGEKPKDIVDFEKVMSGESTTELTEKRKKQLFLRYFNWVLNSLF